MDTTKLDANPTTNLSSILLPEEELQWSGQSQAFPLICNENRTSLLIRWIACAILAVVLSVLYAVFSVRSVNGYNIIVEIVIIIAIAYAAILVPVLDRRNLMSKSLYCITNKRILVFIADRPVITLNRSGLNCKCVSAENGCVHILFGAATKTKPTQFRLRTITPQTNDTGEIPVGAIFYNVKKEDIPADILTLS